MRKYNTSGFTLVEMLIVIAVLLIVMWIAFISFDTNGTKDTVRTKTIKDMQVYLEDFKQTYWVYPNNGSSGRKYPSGCSVSWYESLMSCLVTIEAVKQDSESYNKLKNDPSQWEYNKFEKEYTFYYGTANRWNLYKICALAGKQNNPDYKGLDWNDATEWSRYICVTSADTKLTDVSTMTK